MPGTAQAVETHWCITPSVRAVAKNDPANAGNPADAGAESAVLSESGGVVQTLTTGGACDFWYFYDANGNVGQLLRYDAAGGTVNLAAAYEYDPYGNTLAARDVDGSGIATANQYRFSTKRLVDYATPGQGGAVGTTGLYYYGYRFYSPGLGRWITRDPIEERGGASLYAALRNTPVMAIDTLGLETSGVIRKRDDWGKLGNEAWGEWEIRWQCDDDGGVQIAGPNLVDDSLLPEVNAGFYSVWYEVEITNPVTKYEKSSCCKGKVKVDFGVTLTAYRSLSVVFELKQKKIESSTRSHQVVIDCCSPPSSKPEQPPLCAEGMKACYNGCPPGSPVGSYECVSIYDPCPPLLSWWDCGFAKLP